MGNYKTLLGYRKVLKGLSITILILSVLGCSYRPSHCDSYLSASKDFLLELDQNKESDFYAVVLDQYRCKDISSVEMVFPNQIDDYGFYGILIRSKLLEYEVDSTLSADVTLFNRLSNKDILFGGNRFKASEITISNTDTIEGSLLVKGILRIDSINHLCLITLRD